MENYEVVDSFRVWNHRMLGREMHERRTLRACELLGLPFPPTQLWDRAMQAGDGFPKLSITKDRARLIVRPCPPLKEQIALHPIAIPDPRRYPTAKGPDIALLGWLRETAGQQGYDDVILTDPDGFVLEAGHGNIIWAKDGKLMGVDPKRKVFRGITQRLIFSSGVPYTYGYITPEELFHTQHWVVNSLHGVRRGYDRPLDSPEAQPCGEDQIPWMAQMTERLWKYYADSPQT
ncbi:MAG: aminotransferase class IV [Corynebacterium sp.]|nr:aminotransferase class IV [Corynebacterium sp.]